MKRAPLIATSVLLLAAPAAMAADLVTPAAFVGSAHTAGCKLLNVSTGPITGRAQIYDSAFNALLADTGVRTIPPGQSIKMLYRQPGKDVYCRFVKASKSKSRGSLIIFGFSGDTTDEVVVPAT